MIPPIASVQDVALIVGPLFSAVAAGAAWAAVAQNNRVNMRSQQPSLRIQLIEQPQTHRYGAVIINVGDGIASGVGFAVADRETVISHHVGHGFLRPGEVVQVLAPRPAVRLQQDERFYTRGVAICRDRFGIPHDWTSGEDHHERSSRKLRDGLRKRPVYTDLIELLCQRFPEWTPKANLIQIEVVEQRKVDARAESS